MPQQPGHILFVTGEYPPMPGGVGAYTAEVAAALADRGWQVSVLTSQLAAPTDTHPLPMASNAVTLYPVMHQWHWHVLGDGVTWAQKIGADWVHVQYQTAAFGMHPAINFAPAWWRRQGLRVAWTYHDILVPYLFPKAGSWLRRKVTDLPARVCDLTIATNAGDASHLKPLARNLANIPIGSNIQTQLLTRAARVARRTQRGYGDDAVVVGYFGFLNRSKGGLDLMATVARLLPDLPTLHLLMIGEQVGASDPTNYAYLQEVKAAIHAHGLETRVTWTGYQADSDVSADLAACDLLLMPYLDGASLRRGTLMAGLAHGCAIVTTTPTAPLPELVDGRDLLYVPPGDIDAAASAVRKLIDDIPLRVTLGRNAHVASQAFAWDSIAAAHERCYFDPTCNVSNTTPPSGND